MNTMPTTTLNDAELVAECLSGNPQAFGLIVERHQTLLCSVAYSATGSLSASEDLAQQTFVAAWRQLRELREPAKLRAWLCGILRNQVHEARRRSRREPADGAEPIEAVAGSPAPGSLPAEQAISREEEAILWRSLERIPGTYREPLILYYRQHQSIREVAAALELSEDAVKQRLARGRGMLLEQVTAFVEGALRRSGPGRAFTVGVVAALPALTVSATAAAAGATAAKGSAAAPLAAAGLSGALLGPLLGILGGYVGARASIENTRSPRERRFMVRLSWVVAALALAFGGALLGLLLAARTLVGTWPGLFAALLIGLLGGYTVGLVGLILWANRRQRRIQREESAKEPPVPAPVHPTSALTPFEYRTDAALFGLPLVHIRYGRAPGAEPDWAKGWIAIGDRAVGIVFSLGGIAFGGCAVGGLSAGLVSVGGVAIGLAAIGGAALGGLALGGLAVGGLAVGGGAIGYLAVGGGALGWKAAMGGLAIAREFAQGGQAAAQHVADAAARAYFEHSAFFNWARSLTRASSSPWTLPVILVCSLAPGLVLNWRQRRARSRTQPGLRPLRP